MPALPWGLGPFCPPTGQRPSIGVAFSARNLVDLALPAANARQYKVDQNIASWNPLSTWLLHIAAL
jgi:hypothetical protein